MRSRFFRIFALPMLVVACCVLPAFGGDSSVKIIGPSEVEAGNLVVLRAEAPGACVWASVPPVDFLTFDDQKTLVFASPKEQSIVFVLASVTDSGPVLVTHTLHNGPAPEPDPDPDPDPEPLPPSELWAFVIEESANRTPEQAIVIASPEIRSMFSEGCFRVVDPLVDGAQVPVSADVKPYAERAVLQKEKWPMLFLVDTDGKVRYEGPLPATVEEMKTLVETHKQGVK